MELENIPKPPGTVTTEIIIQEWEWIYIDNFLALKNHNVKENLNGISTHTLEGVSMLSMFLVLFLR